MAKRILMLIAGLSLLACSLKGYGSIWVGGSYGVWSEASNWDPPAVPTTDVTISSDGSPVYVLVDMDANIYSLHAYGSIDLLDGVKLPRGRFRITAPNSVTNHNGLELHRIEIVGNVNNCSGAEVELSGVDIMGHLINPVGGEITVWSVSDVTEEIQNAGLLTFDPGSELWTGSYFSNTGQILIHNGECTNDGAFQNNTTGSIIGAGVISSDELFENAGEIYALGGTLVVTSKGSLMNTGTLANKPNASLYVETLEDVNNHGTVEVNAGAGVTFAGALVNESDGAIKLLGGTLGATTVTQRADANFAGFGTISGNVEIETNGLISLSGPTNIIGDVNIEIGATLEIRDGQTLITGHTICDGAIRLIGGTVIFQGSCDCDGCTITNEAGTNRNHFDINADGIEDLKDLAEFAESWLWEATWHD